MHDASQIKHENLQNKGFAGEDLWRYAPLHRSWHIYLADSTSNLLMCWPTSALKFQMNMTA